MYVIFSSHFDIAFYAAVFIVVSHIHHALIRVLKQILISELVRLTLWRYVTLRHRFSQCYLKGMSFVVYFNHAARIQILSARLMNPDQRGPEKNTRKGFPRNSNYISTVASIQVINMHSTVR
jgi:hypothetical protein